MTIETIPTTLTRYNGTGSEDVFTYSFTPLEADDVLVYVWNTSTEVWDLKTVDTDYTQDTTAKTITFSSGAGAGTGNVIITRQTDITNPKVDYVPGSVIRSADLDSNQSQVLNSLQEQSQFSTTSPQLYGNLDMNSRKITDVAACTNANDAANKSYVDATLTTQVEVDERITLLMTDVGGFIPIANETSFPDDNPDINDAAGTLVSIQKLATGFTTTNDGSATDTEKTISNGNVSNDKTVKIIGLTANTTYPTDYGMIVETQSFVGTDTTHTYKFHRLIAKATDVSTVATNNANITTVANEIDNVNNFADKYQIASNAPTARSDESALVTGDLYFNTSNNTLFVRTSAGGWDSVVDTTSTLVSKTALGATTLPGASSYSNYFLKTDDAGNLTWAPTTTVLTTEGDILYRNSTTDTRLAKGTAGQVLTINAGATAPEWSTIDKLQVEAQADGSIANNAAVIIKSDGQVSEVGETLPSYTSNIQFNPQDGTGYYLGDCAQLYEPVSKKLVMTFRGDGTGYRYVVGDVTATSISFGTIAKIPHNDGSLGLRTRHVALTYDSTNNKILAAYYDPDNADKAYIKAGTIDGTTIDWEDAVQMDASASSWFSIAYSKKDNKFAAIWKDDNEKWISRTGNVSTDQWGNPTVSLDSMMDITPNNAGSDLSINYKILYDSANEVFVTAMTNGSTGSTDANKVRMQKWTFNSGSASYPSYGTVTDTDKTGLQTSGDLEDLVTTNNKIYLTIDTTNDRYVLIYEDNSTGYPKARVVRPTSTGLDGNHSDIVIATHNTNELSVTFDEGASQVLVASRDGDDSNKIKCIAGTVDTSNDTTTWNAVETPTSVEVSHMRIDYDVTHDKSILTYTRLDSGTDYGDAQIRTATTTNVTTDNFLGFSKDAYTNSETATIGIVGSVHTSSETLTPGQKYYVQGDGTLGLEPMQNWVGKPDVYAGLAITTSTLLVKG